MASHTHPCQSCGQPEPCLGEEEENYDGHPAVICAVFHLPLGRINPDFLCERCDDLTDDELADVDVD